MLPTSVGGIMKWWAVSVCLSVCPSIRPSSVFVARLDLTWERNWPRKPKMSRMETHRTYPRTYLEVKRLKVTVTRPINAFTDNALANTPIVCNARWRFGAAVEAGRGITIFLKICLFMEIYPCEPFVPHLVLIMRCAFGLTVGDATQMLLLLFIEA